MKKMLEIIILTTVLVNSVFTMNVLTHAAENEMFLATDGQSEYSESEIDRLFSQRDQILLSVYDQIATSDSNIEVAALSESVNYLEEIEHIDEELASLGVRKIDPENPDDMAYLMELPLSADCSTEMRVSGIYDSAPNLAAVASLYDIYISDGSIAPFYDGTTEGQKSYSYRHIRVTDKANGQQYLYERRRVKLLTKSEIMQNVASALLNYNFEFVLDQFIGKLPAGTLIQWTLGNFEAFKNASNITVGGNAEAGYTTAYSTVTTMNYYFLYTDNYGWKLIGTGASAAAIRRDYFIGEIDGKEPEEDIIYKDGYTMRDNGTTLRQYVAAYVSVMDRNPNYHAVSALGTLKVKVYNGEKVPYTPKFAEEPGDLLTLQPGQTYSGN